MSDLNLVQPLKKILPTLLAAQEHNLNEADTRIRIVKVLSDVLGYDEMNDITSEQRIRHRYADFAVKIDNTIKFLIEVKAAGVKLRSRHIEQAERYAAQGNIRWVLLTNCVEWHLYHLTFEEGIDYELAFSIDLNSDKIGDASSLLGILHRKSVMKNLHERYWEEQLAISAQSLGRALFTQDVLMRVRTEIRRTSGFLVDIEDLAVALRELFSSETREQIGPLKITRKLRRK